MEIISTTASSSSLPILPRLDRVDRLVTKTIIKPSSFSYR